MLARSFVCMGRVGGEEGNPGFPTCAGEQLSSLTINVSFLQDQAALSLMSLQQEFTGHCAFTKQGLAGEEGVVKERFYIHTQSVCLSPPPPLSPSDLMLSFGIAGSTGSVEERASGRHGLFQVHGN